jgi:MFS family permease
VLLPLIGVFSLTFNTTANSSVQLATDPVMRGRVMSLYMMVFVGGTPIGGPIFGWLTDTFGPRLSFLFGGLVAAGSAIVVGIVLARAVGLRLKVDLRAAARGRGKDRRLIAFVPRAEGPEPTPDPEPRLTAAA